uniref:Adhesion G protein-coupled receptor G7 n=1 Tax=Anser cygnoides TaxID=8845 RepID=A0A8B9DQS7_ANSCY
MTTSDKACYSCQETIKIEITETVVPPCFCHNGGICQDGACVCPDEWIGLLCDIGYTYTYNNSEDDIKNLTFERIIVGKYGSSKEKCEPHTVNGMFLSFYFHFTKANIRFVKDVRSLEQKMRALCLKPEQQVQAAGAQICPHSFLPQIEGSSNNRRAGFVLYQNDKLFQSQTYTSHNNFSKQVVSGNIDGGTANGVEIAFNPKYNTSKLQLHDYACVFWDYAVNDWNTVGCTKERGQFLRCKCNHTTHFAVLMAFRINYKYAKPLEYISYVGVGLSIAGLVITILFQIFTRKTRKSSVTWMLVSLCSSMLTFNIIFISGIENRNARNHSTNTSGYEQQYSTYYTTNNTLPKSDTVDPPEDSWCMAVAVLLHYFLLATFMWTALNCAQLYLLLLRAMKPLPGNFIVTMSVIGWGIPAVVVAVTLGATYREGKALNYRQEEFCWLAALDQDQNFSIKKPMLWSFLLPVALILLFNIIIFIKIVVSVIWKENKDLTRNKKDSFMGKITSTISVVVVLGITWTTGYFMLINQEETSLVFNYVFCILNATQGIQICILYTFRSPTFKKKVSKMSPAWKMPEISFYLHSQIYHVSKLQPVKYFRETFRSFETENISFSTFSDCY